MTKSKFFRHCRCVSIGTPTVVCEMSHVSGEWSVRLVGVAGPLRHHAATLYYPEYQFRDVRLAAEKCRVVAAKFGRWLTEWLAYNGQAQKEPK